MTHKIAAAVAAAFVLASAATVSAQPIGHASRPRALTPDIQVYDSAAPPQGNGQYCYLPSGPCDNEHRMAN
jgi:hypothetical protein